MAERGEIEPGFYWARPRRRDGRRAIHGWRPIQIEIATSGTWRGGLIVRQFGHGEPADANKAVLAAFEFGPRLTPPPPGEPI